MRRGSRTSILWSGALIGLFALLQALALVHACDESAPQHDLECLEYAQATDGGAPDLKAGWPHVRIPFIHAAPRVWRVETLNATSAPRHPRLFLAAPNLSIALLNLRQ